VAARLEDDPDRTADRNALVSALGRIGSPAGGDVLTGLLGGDDAGMRARAFTTLLEIAKDRTRGARLLDGGARREAYQDALALAYLGEAAASTDVQLRLRAAAVLRDVDDTGAEDILARLIEDRDGEVRVAAAEALAFRAEHVAGASIDTLARTLRAGRRELVLPAAAGLASRQRKEALQSLFLVFKAGAQDERERAVLALGQLGDRRALEELEPLIDPKSRAEIDPEDAQLAPAAIEALGRLLPRLHDTEDHGPELTRVRDTVERLAREGEPDMRRRALTGLRHAGDDRSRALIERVAGDVHDSADERVHAIGELGLLGSAQSEPVLADLLGEDHHAVRLAALRALERIFPKERTRTSLLALRSAHDDISAPAATFLARRGDPAVLVGRLSTIDSDDVRQRLRQGLIRRRACPNEQLAALLQGEAAGPRADAAWIAGACGQSDLAGPAKAALERSQAQWLEARQRISGAHDDTGRARMAAAEDAWQASLWAADRLSAKAGAAARAAVTMRDAPAPVRCAALRFLAHHGSAADLDLVRACLTDPDAAVRARAAATAATLAPARAQELIEHAVVADAAALGPVVKAAIAGSPGAARELLGRDRSRRLVLPAVLGDRRSPELAGSLVALATAPGQDTARLAAIAALGRAGGDQAAAALQAILDDKTEIDAVRAAAFKALRRLQRRAVQAARHKEASA
jgi:ParB family chromosome partitioning protein